MFKHTIALLDGALFANLGNKDAGKAERIEDYAHAIAVLKAAGGMDKRDALKVIEVISKSYWDDEYLEAINALRDFIEALPEVKE